MKKLLQSPAVRTFLVLLAFLSLSIGIVRISSRTTNKNVATNLPKPTNSTKQVKNVTDELKTLHASQDNTTTFLLAKSENYNTSKLVTNLPNRIKHINFVNPEKIIFISELDEYDRGRKIVNYDSTSEIYQTIAEAEADWSIDDVVISKDGNYIAWWEVRFGNTGTLLLGKSRVFVRNLQNQSAKVLIVDEISTPKNPVRYPMFFDANNNLYMDSFIPNGGGFYLGLFSASPEIANRITPVLNMENGQYYSDPEISPDGTKILFVASDPNASLQASMGNPNQIIVMDLNTNTKEVVKGSENGAVQYAKPLWSLSGEKIAFQGYRITNPYTSSFEGLFYKDLLTNQTEKLNITPNEKNTLLSFHDNKIVWGVMTNLMGNLGKEYSEILSEINITDLENDLTQNILTQPFIQYVDNTLNQLSLTDLGDESTVKLAQFQPNQVSPDRKIQQNDPSGPKWINIRPSLSPFRPPDPNLPRCRDVCGDKSNWASCFSEGKCYDSPLYLYPEETTSIMISVNRDVFADMPKSKNGQWQVTASPDGKITYQENKYNYISYLYTGEKQSPPNTGIVSSYENLEKTLRGFASSLNLNNRETQDFVNFWMDYLPFAKYYQVSVYDSKTADKIISYEFDPKPDTFIQIIMYFKPLENYKEISPPQIEIIPRQGFVAVDWSGVIDQ